MASACSAGEAFGRVWAPVTRGVRLEDPSPEIVLVRPPDLI